MLKLLLLHNHYGSKRPSGENSAFLSEGGLLVRRGHQVRTYERSSDAILGAGRVGLVRGAVSTPWNVAAAWMVKHAVQEFEPDIVHAHNLFPLLSPSVLAGSAAGARVLTLHNYRLFCAAGIPMRNGRPCTECLQRRSAAGAVRYGCYRESRMASVPLAVSIELHRRRRTWHRDVDAFIALTEFQREKMVAAGLPRDRVWVKPNHCPGSPGVVPWHRRALGVVFVGRLGPEKGVQDLVSAWRIWGSEAPPLVLAGEGPLRPSLAEAVGGGLARVELLGQVPAQRAQALIGTSRLLVLPSRCFEGFPMVLAEALALGTPVVVSNLGPLPELVRCGAGALVSPGNPEALARTLRDLWADQDRLERMGAAARRAYEERYTEDAGYERLMEIYEQAMQVARWRRRRGR